MNTITPWLSFDTEAEEAVNLYVSLFPNSEVSKVTHYGPAMPQRQGTVMTVEFTLDGREFIALNGGPHGFNESFSLMVLCEDQEEVDRYWNALTADGGEESMCGWLKDKYGLSWQITPKILLELTTDPDPERAQAAVAAMLDMRKIVIADLEQAVAAAA